LDSTDGIWETPQHGSPSFAMSARKGQRARHDALDYRIDGTRELRPKALASFFVPAPSLKDFILCFRSENNTSGHSLANNFRRTSDQGPRCRVSSRGRPTGDPAQPVVQAQRHFTLALVVGQTLPQRHRQLGPIAGREPQQLREYAGFHGVILSCGIRCGKAGAMVHDGA